MTIEERAENYANKLRCEAYCPAHGFGTGDYEPEEGLSEEEYTYSIDGYTTGATEQQEIDMYRIENWYCDKCVWAGSCTLRHSQDVCAKIEEIRQVIKGE